MNKKKCMIAVLAVVMVACIAILATYFIKQNKAKSEYDDLKKKGKKETAEDTKKDNPIDFDALQKENADIYAWITIPGTEIDYPILQHSTDDSYYLNHTVEGKEGLPGSIYTESVNSKEFTDFNTIVYGHNMKNGTMFKNLHKYEEQDFLNQYPYIYIYLPDKTLKYQIFAAVTFSDEHIMYRYDFSEQEGQTEYINDILQTQEEKAIYNQELTVTNEDTLITLATCIANQSNKRWLVVAKLIEE